MDAALITTAMTSVRSIKESLEIALEYKSEKDRRETIAHFLQQMGMIQETLFHLRHELSRLHVENAQLRQALKQSKLA